jgi:ureidoacrylate peracid hydrolase
VHSVSIRPEIIERVRARSGRTQWFERLNPISTALVVVDMQAAFCAPGAPAEVPRSRGVVAPINELTRELRKLGCPVIWVTQSNTFKNGRSDWEVFFQHVLGGDVRERSKQVVAPGNHAVWEELEVAEADHTVTKNRYSALNPGASRLEQLLRSLKTDTVLIAGTKTNVCCESLARDAMMLDYKVVMLSDCCAALSDDEHRSALENVFQQFGDVSTSKEALRKLKIASSA